jgi:hypothetical protein
VSGRHARDERPVSRGQRAFDRSLADQSIRGGGQKRNRPAKLLTLSPEAWERLDAIAAARGTSRSGAVEQLIRRARLESR